jgi:hypothetical protein
MKFNKLIKTDQILIKFSILANFSKTSVTHLWQRFMEN